MTATTTTATRGTVNLKRGFASERNAQCLPDGTVEYRERGRWVTAAPEVAQTFTGGPWL